MLRLILHGNGNYKIVKFYFSLVDSNTDGRIYSFNYSSPEALAKGANFNIYYRYYVNNYMLMPNGSGGWENAPDSSYYSAQYTLGVIVWDTITNAAIVIMGDN